MEAIKELFPLPHTTADRSMDSAKLNPATSQLHRFFSPSNQRSQVRFCNCMVTSFVFSFVGDVCCMGQVLRCCLIISTSRWCVHVSIHQLPSALMQSPPTNQPLPKYLQGRRLRQIRGLFLWLTAPVDSGGRIRLTMMILGTDDSTVKLKEIL